MWFKISKTPEQKLAKQQRLEELQQEVDALNLKYKDEINSYCKINSFIFIFRQFCIKNNEVCIMFLTDETIEGYVESLPYYWFEQKYGESDMTKARFNFLKFKTKLKNLGLELKQIEK